MGNEADVIRARFPGVLAVTGPHQYEAVVGAVHEAAPWQHSPYLDLVPEAGLKLTPRHYSYLDRKSTRRTPVTNAHLVCRLLLEKKKKNTYRIYTTIISY